MKTLVCRPTYEGDPPVPSEKANCDVCGQEVWVPPASVSAAGENPRIICTACVSNVLASDPEAQIVMPPAETQNGELESR